MLYIDTEGCRQQGLPIGMPSLSWAGTRRGSKKSQFGELNFRFTLWLPAVEIVSPTKNCPRNHRLAGNGNAIIKINLFSRMDC